MKLKIFILSLSFAILCSCTHETLNTSDILKSSKAESSSSSSILINQSKVNKLLEDISVEKDEWSNVITYESKITLPKTNISLSIYNNQQDPIELRIILTYFKKSNTIYDMRYSEFKPDNNDSFTFTPKTDKIIADLKNGNDVEMGFIYTNDSYDIQKLEYIINSKKTISRFFSLTNYFSEDREVTQEEKDAMKQILDLFYAMGGKIS